MNFLEQRTSLRTTSDSVVSIEKVQANLSGTARKIGFVTIVSTAKLSIQQKNSATGCCDSLRVSLFV